MHLDVVDYAEHAMGSGADATAVAYVETVDDEGTPLGCGDQPQHHHGVVAGGGLGGHAPADAHRVVRRLARLALFAGLAGLVLRLLRRALAARAALDAAATTRAQWPPLAPDAPPDPAARTRMAHPPAARPPAPAAAAAAPERAAAAEPPPVAEWVPPVDGRCPDGHPVKAKQASGIYHLPGMMNYVRTVPDRCYASAAGAEADGFRPAKR